MHGDAACPAASDAEVARLPSDDAAIAARLARLERAIGEHREAVDRRLAILEDAVLGLQRMLRPEDLPAEREAAAPAPAEPALRERRLAELEAAGRERIAALSEALAAVERSTSWRITAPLRAVARALPPPARHALHQLLRGVYWAMTPQRMMARLRSFSYVPLIGQSVKRLDYLSAATRRHLGMPLRRAYGSSTVEQLDIFAAPQRDAAIFVFVHGGAWREGEARDYAFPAEMFVAAGAHYVALDFIAIREAGGDLGVMAEQVRRAIAWIYRNAATFGGDPERIYIGGHSSGGQLCGAALVTDWRQDFGLPEDIIKGALLMSGVFDLGPVRRSGSNPHLRFTDEIEEAMSAIRHIDRLHAPVVITYGSNDTPEFQRQSREFCAAARQAGKPVELIEAASFGHMEMLELFGNPFGPNGRAALAMMRLAHTSPLVR